MTEDLLALLRGSPPDFYTMLTYHPLRDCCQPTYVKAFIARHSLDSLVGHSRLDEETNTSTETMSSESQILQVSMYRVDSLNLMETPAYFLGIKNSSIIVRYVGGV